jgi:hypothetical protein
MMMKNVYSIALAALVLATTAAIAGETTPADKTPAKHEKDQATQDMTVIGTVAKHENKKKDGSTMMAWYILTDDEGKEVHLPKGKIEEFVGIKVKITGNGYITEKKRKTVRTLKSIATIEKVETAPAPAK